MVNNLSPSAASRENRLDTVLKEEELGDQANHFRSFVGVRHRLRCCLRAAARLGAARLASTDANTSGLPTVLARRA
ncbi:MAG: hypothetical protein ACLT98_13350 [Eggerthellaceae bacterium]